jgi:hypothetical protein
MPGHFIVKAARPSGLLNQAGEMAGHRAPQQAAHRQPARQAHRGCNVRLLGLQAKKTVAIAYVLSYLPSGGAVQHARSQLFRRFMRFRQ